MIIVILVRIKTLKHNYGKQEEAPIETWFNGGLFSGLLIWKIPGGPKMARAALLRRVIDGQFAAM